MNDDVRKFPRHGIPGYYALGDLPQGAPLDQIVISAGWSELDPIFKFYPSQLVVVTGKPGHGKSTLVFNMLLNIAELHGMRSFLYVPENEKGVREKLRKIWHAKARQSSFEYVLGSQLFIQSAQLDNDGEPRTPLWVFERAQRAIERDHVEVVMIDPWNWLEHYRARDELMTEYINSALHMAMRFARQFEVIVIMIAHPTKEARAADHIPMMADIEGSMAWWNKPDNGLVVFREEFGTTQVISAKVREEPEAGTQGMRRFHVDPASGLFIPAVGPASDYEPPTRKHYGHRRGD